VARLQVKLVAIRTDEPICDMGRARHLARRRMRWHQLSGETTTLSRRSLLAATPVEFTELLPDLALVEV